LRQAPAIGRGFLVVEMMCGAGGLHTHCLLQILINRIKEAIG